MADRLLLDTHIVLWSLFADPRLSPRVIQAIDEAGEVRVSAASAWEVAIKVGLGRLTIPEPFEAAVRRSGFEPLPVTFAHAREVEHLPPLHRDPFDRLLVGAAVSEGFVLVSADERVLAYPVATLRA